MALLSFINQDKINRKFAQLSFNATARIRIYRQLNRLLAGRVPLPQAIEELYRRASKENTKPDRPLAITLREWVYGIRAGRSLGDSIAAWVPASERMLLEAGEASGDLGQALADAAEVAVGGRQMTRVMIWGSVYPLIMIAALIAALWGFSVYVIPPFAQMLPLDQWEGSAAGVAALSSAVRNWTIPIVLGIVSFGVIYALTVARWTGRVRIFFDRLPPWSFYRLNQGISFLLSFSALSRAGMQQSAILDRLREDATPYLKERLDLTIRNFRAGMNIGEALDATGTGFPEKEINEDMRIFANLPSFQEALNTQAKDWLNESVIKVQSQSKAFGFVMLILIFVVVMWMSFGLFQVQQQVVNAANMNSF